MNTNTISTINTRNTRFPVLVGELINVMHAEGLPTEFNWTDNSNFANVKKYATEVTMRKQSGITGYCCDEGGTSYHNLTDIPEAMKKVAYTSINNNSFVQEYKDRVVVSMKLTVDKTSTKMGVSYTPMANFSNGWEVWRPLLNDLKGEVKIVRLDTGGTSGMEYFANEIASVNADEYDGVIYAIYAICESFGGLSMALVQTVTVNDMTTNAVYVYCPVIRETAVIGPSARELAAVLPTIMKRDGVLATSDGGILGELDWTLRNNIRLECGLKVEALLDAVRVYDTDDDDGYTINDVIDAFTFNKSDEWHTIDAVDKFVDMVKMPIFGLNELKLIGITLNVDDGECPDLEIKLATQRMSPRTFEDWWGEMERTGYGHTAYFALIHRISGVCDAIRVGVDTFESVVASLNGAIPIFIQATTDSPHGEKANSVVALHVAENSDALSKLLGA